MSWFNSLKEGLKKSSNKITDTFHAVFKKKRLDQATLDQLEESMILADFGISTAQEICQKLKKEKFEKDISEDELRQWLANHVSKILEPVAKPLNIKQTGPHVILVIGVNGAGKTTSIAKMASYFKQDNKTVHVAACDTFRAGAIDQLKVWSARVGFELYFQKEGSDPASLAFDALKKSKEQNVDILIIDTAGRLHNKINLMDEMKKIVRVIQKIDKEAPHTALLLLDATSGQNVIQQLKQFKEAVPIDGLVLTKVDGTAKGGIVVALAKEFNIPINFLGVGEKAEDLQPFKSDEFSRHLFNLATTQ